ncbi:MAG: short-chain dehydrogenase [Polynucleobacter sp. 24-46-87]|jgi:NADP-dependent 3-hydroxy acid dehydrogenase YdfG|uniref:SDR family NAD(P)-dependent oxidoreductase n=1 Tax=Polynucleobacter sp. es-EL-1 TaxID=1855652 RepID=UPI000BD3DD28|nr:SDR family NAD(P)-dependent oxidoreductase [Polynucleobacter sp. es-EL-1]OYY54689.1 MAG: short-chain dehydrogenase [Polynucleobacter sp. 35-46-207]OYZ38017.1 MAG: short-chain dehydrogenase [Polynucleobacter sp. 16-46-70]OZA01027.1 MAG: short-chain dehydrogenase [Polynucleobacter sp. 24-46-87]OZA41085.1 MAG: short-chain dehydrogenase [Polynucleobacter sp. 17-46-58]HQR83563.1 SDR family NAD(P)-dependent oxidoreductase [Polynucleobacter sp.]
MKQKGISNFSGQRIWIIGASSGIGEACAKALFQAGAKVALSSRRAERLTALADKQDALVLPLDVTHQEQLASAYQTLLQNWGGLDLMLFVSGVYTPLRADNFDFEVAQKTIDANLLGPMRAVATVLPEMLKQHTGHIAIVGSVAGYSGLPKALAYGPSKAGIINFCETLYYDLLPQGVSVHMISPGFVATEATAQNDFEMPALITAEEAASEILKGIQAGEFDIHFPKRFSGFLKFLRILPYPLYFWIVRRFVKI